MATVEVNEINLLSGQSPWWRVRAIAGPVPALLHVNKEARSFMRQSYRLFLETPTQGRPVYFDVTRDILYLDWASWSFLRAFYGRYMWMCPYSRRRKQEWEHMHDTEHGVRHLALKNTLQWGNEPMLQILPRYSNLERIILLECYPNPPWNASAKAYEKQLKQSWIDAGSKVPHFERLGSTEFKQRFCPEDE